MVSMVGLDIAAILSDLRMQWLRSQQYCFNTTAFTRLRPTGNNIMFCCPHHPENNPSCGIMVDFPYGWSCFGCGSSGNLQQLVSYALSVSEIKAMRYIVKNYTCGAGLKRNLLDIDRLFGCSGRMERTEDGGLVGAFLSKRHTYLYKRGFSDHTLDKYEVGYDEGKGAITFPVRDSKGIVRFIQRRSVHGKMFFNEKSIQKKDILYGLYYIVSSGKRIEELYLVESITDVLSCYEVGFPAVAIMGRILFKEQIMELLRAGIKKVNLFLDNDQWGREGAEKACQLLKKTPVRIAHVATPDSGYKDANDLLVAGKLKTIQIIN